MNDWFEFILSLVAFLGSHIVPIRFKDRLTARLGRRGYLALYSLLSLALLLWVIAAAGRAPFIQLWPQPLWSRWLVNLVMPVAVFLGATAGLGGVLTGFTLWACAHLIANGDVAHVILFGLLLTYAVAGLARLRPRLAPRLTPLRLLIAVALWAGLYHLHPLITGVSPLP